MDIARDHAPGVSSLAALLADAGRMTMLWALMDGSARPAGELALVAGLSPSSASGHLARLVDGGVLAQESRGRHRYFRIATPEAAAAIEALASAVLATQELRPRPVPANRVTPVPLRHARTCYDHLAGEVAVELFARMQARQWIRVDGSDVALTDAGMRGMTALGVDLSQAHTRRRRFACTCPDWSERKPHLGGALGAALLGKCLEAKWLEPTRVARALRVTPLGDRKLADIAA
ncbi:ArsR/SmtB family transcription factor [Pandoraea pnomenusa]|jgi:DNA-binding transcriptional ArsR family regulator|uniref:Helix-turn-helix domain n=1 Tax=Pandoraea pnomenusa TaxID=93220 RepID=A0A378YWR3_9BURK|nr:winged helix-turn-helix domain-containing protein [Pandoraea pnomenusa]AHB07046.1 ArsR family transcriptional regulator [Pandoraea pnomenusa 3kgm]AIU28614.1 ArsR family transcriptional regulator [Pandoraea pnomenusa]ANC45642.1 transcriptional regulator [Pandoraea pnomenusa]SUA80987.1 Helix-turn-helix domain [Pandoraea pnomenusa]